MGDVLGKHTDRTFKKKSPKSLLVLSRLYNLQLFGKDSKAERQSPGPKREPRRS